MSQAVLDTSPSHFVDSQKCHNVAVIGAGVFGTYHARKLLVKKNVNLVAIVDTDIDRARQLADEVGCEALSSLDELFRKRVDAVHIATPAKYHADQLLACIERGIHCYVEKPMTVNALEAEQISVRARNKGVKIHVGHQERFSANAMGLFSGDDQPRDIRAIRVAPPSGTRNRDVSVIWDLMIHDLDLVMKIMDSEIIGAKSSAIFSEDGVLDEVKADVEFANGKVARLVASRVASERGRIMSLSYPNGVVEIDYVNREILGAELVGLEADISKMDSDPLQLSVDEFYRSIEEDDESSICGLVGARAVRAAQVIEESCKHS